MLSNRLGLDLDSAGLLAINGRHSAYGAGVNAPRHKNIASLPLQITRIL